MTADLVAKYQLKATRAPGAGQVPLLPVRTLSMTFESTGDDLKIPIEATAEQPFFVSQVIFDLKTAFSASHVTVGDSSGATVFLDNSAIVEATPAVYKSAVSKTYVANDYILITLPGSLTTGVGVLHLVGWNYDA